MKTKIYLPLIAAGLLMSACDEQVMEWRESDPTVKPTEIPLELTEVLRKYDYIKNYMVQYHPETKMFIGMGLDEFLASDAYRQVVLDNYQGVTFGNAMKHGSIVKANGKCDWSKVDQFIAMNTGMEIYGHNLLWHTQQNQSYLYSLIQPDMEVVGDDDPNRVCDNVVTNGTFEKGNLNGWIGDWCETHAAEIVPGGHDSDNCLMLTVDIASPNYWSDQRFYELGTPLIPTEKYAYDFWAKTETPGATIQFLWQSAASKQQQTGEDIKLTTEWTRYQGTLTCGADNDEVVRVGLQFGAQDAVIFIDDFQFGKKVEAEVGPGNPDLLRPNIISNGDFKSDRTGWQVFNGGDEGCTFEWDGDEGMFEKGCLKIVNILEEPSNQYKCQIHTDYTTTVPEGEKYYISYYIKTASGTGSVRFSTSGKAHYQPDQVVTPVWQRIEWEITAGGDQTGLCIDIAAVPNTYYIDNIVVSTTPFGASAAKSKARSVSRAASLHYILKSPEEKRAILLDAMERWIKEAMEHMGNTVTGWDVINEPIGDDNKFRGIDGGWMSNSDDDNPVPDSAPVETEEDGLKLNWRSATGNQHFYWGYYLGMDYAVKAFQYARQYSPNGAKLFVNEYNLETSPRKLAKLIEFVNKIEQGGGQVDGIGTQMHVSYNITKEQVDAMFQTMAATGKLVRITELDVKIGTKNPSAEQYEQQAECYKMILTSYFENVPANQRCAITAWTLSDHPDEHKYWIKDDAPNLFDANYARKHAYKGVCDAIAGEDLGAGFESPDYYNH